MSPYQDKQDLLPLSWDSPSCHYAVLNAAGHPWNSILWSLEEIPQRAPSPHWHTLTPLI